MGVFNEQKHNTYGKGIQGAPGVGFNLTADGNYDMINRKLTNVGAPTSNADAATKKYVDDNSSSSTSDLTVDSNIDMKDTYRITNLKHPVDADEPATKQYSDSKFLDKYGGTLLGDLNMNYRYRIYNLPAPTGPAQPLNLASADTKYLWMDGSKSMGNNLNMDNKKIYNLRAPTDNNDAATKKYVDDNTVSNISDLTINSNIDMKDRYRILNLLSPSDSDEPATKNYTDTNFLNRNGLVKMTGNLNMDNKKVIKINPPTNDDDAATKKYVDDNKPDLSDYLEKDGTVTMTGNLNVGSNKIINLGKPTQDNDAVNKNYADKLVHHTTVQPSNYKNEFAYLMSSGSQWTDEIDSGTSFFVSRIGDLSPSKGNFHDYNHKVIFITINKNSQGGCKYKMEIIFYRLTANADYTLCLEILNTDYQLWHKSQISVNKETSTGLSIGNVSVRKLSHRYTQSNGQQQFMYYHRIIVNFRKLSTGNKFFLHILVNIPQDGTDLAVYPRQFLGVYLITYGIVGTFSNIDPDKVYDYHTAFDIKPTEVVYNVDINANQKEIKNIKLNRQNDNSAATVALVKEIVPFTKNALYRLYFSEVYDFANADSYKVNPSASGIVFNKLSSSSGNSLREMDIPDKTIDNIRKEGLNVNGYSVSFTIPDNTTDFTLCLIFYHWRNRSFSLLKKNSLNIPLTNLEYSSNNNQLTLSIYSLRSTLSMLSSFNGKKNVVWLTQSSNNNLLRVKINNYNSLLSLSRVNNSNQQKFEFTAQDGVLCKIMFSPNFYNTDSEKYHKVMLQEKIDGSYIV